MADRDQPVLEKEIMDKTVAYEHREEPRRTSIVQAHDRRHSAILAAGRRESLHKSFDNANLAMVFRDITHLEVPDDEGDSIDDIAVSWFVWLVALQPLSRVHSLATTLVSSRRCWSISKTISTDALPLRMKKN
jgi:hypothetical protein